MKIQKEIWDRKNIALIIIERLKQNFEALQQQFYKTAPSIGYFYIDNLLTNSLVEELVQVFPTTYELTRKKNLREYKYVSAQMSQYDRLVEETLFAFQEPNVVALISKICQIKEIYPDASLYAGGISVMKKDNYLRPHLDNSHDKLRKRWRILNLLYYVTPNWKPEYGGALEIWSNGLEEQPIQIDALFNRLVVMATHELSWHSVNEIKNMEQERCCISNYYFSDVQPMQSTNFHITTFRNPSNKIDDMILQVDNTVRGTIRKVFKKGLVETKHVYKSDKK